MIDRLSFPDSNALRAGRWCPIYFRPNFDTPERLVVGIAACVDGAWHVETASSLEKLRCLYGNEAEVVVELVSAAMRELAWNLKDAPDRSIKSVYVSGITLGEPIVARGHNAKQLALRWLRQVSSLHDRRKEGALDQAEPARVYKNNDVGRRIAKDRLPVLVMEKILEQAPSFRSFFHEHVKKLEQNITARITSHEAYVAFDGQHVAANFSTLRPGRHKTSVDVAKRLMWDLKQHREKENGLYKAHQHNIYLYHPSVDDPTITEKQYENVMDVVGTLAHEGRNLDIEVYPHSDVTQISSALLEAERTS